jgi:hypothetical protein
LLSPAIIIDTKGIIPFHDPFGIRNNLKSERRNSNIYPKLPYDNAAMPVKQIDAFRPYFTGRLIHDLRIAASRFRKACLNAGWMAGSSDRISRD